MLRAGKAAPLERKISNTASEASRPPSTEPDGGSEGTDDAAEWAFIAGGGWPFQNLCGQLCVDLLDPAWEVRHGAASALREVLRCQAGGAAVTVPLGDDVSGWCDPQAGEGEWNSRVLNCHALIN